MSRSDQCVEPSPYDTNHGAFAVWIYLIIIAVANLALGYGLATFLHRRSGVETPRD